MSIVTNVDSYKVSHHNQFPKGTQFTRYYVEARGGEYVETVMAGINYVVQALEQGLTVKEVDRARALYKEHFGAEYFAYDQWLALAKRVEQGKGLPLSIEAIPEGTVVPVKTALATVTNTDPEFFWLPGWIEPMFLRMWYPITVATKSRECKKVLHSYLSQSSDLTGMDYWMTLGTRLHDFGARGATSEESSALGGLSHLYNFIGTDTVAGMILAQDLFDYKGAAGISVAAREHSTTTSWGKDNETDAYLNSIDLFGKSIYSCVMDSYDFEEAVMNMREYKDKIIEAGGTFVVRPDSGNMCTNIEFALETLGEIFGFKTNSKGYKVLNKHVRIIQGDGLDDHNDIEKVCDFMVNDLGWSIENIAFGMGGGLHQKVNRDTCKFAMKCSAIMIDNVWQEVYKAPKDAMWKASKKGYLITLRRGKEFITIDSNAEDAAQYIKNGYTNAMRLYYHDGVMPMEDSLQSIRTLAAV